MRKVGRRNFAAGPHDSHEAEWSRTNGYPAPANTKLDAAGLMCAQTEDDRSEELSWKYVSLS